MAFTLDDIAQLTSLSTATVSRVLNGKPGVNKATRDKVLAMARELGYQPNYLAKSIKTRHTRTVGMVVADITNPFYAEVAKTVETEARKLDYTVILGNTGNSAAEGQRIMEELSKRQVDGFIIAAAELRDDAVKRVLDSGIPVMLYHRHAGETLPCNFIGCDEHRAVVLALEHLAGLGHRKVAFVSGSKRFSTGLERVKAFMELRGRFGLDGNANLIKEGGYDMAKTSRAVEELLSMQSRPSAIFAANDFMALQVMDKLMEMGFSVPQDVSVIGLDNIPIAAHHRISLSTIDINITSGAKQAILSLVNLMQGVSASAQPIRILQEPKLVVRTSTAPRP